MEIAKVKTDNIGIVTSGLCLIHCIATPFIFISKSCTSVCCAGSPGWWSSLDFIFLVISALAVYKSGKNSAKIWVKYCMWISWFLLLAIIVNETTQAAQIPEYAIYIPAVFLIALHLYNLKYCKCKKTTCCAH